MRLTYALAAPVAACALLAGHAAAQSDPFTNAGDGVRPALDEICSKTPAAVARPAFIRQISERFGFDWEQEGGFLRTGDNGRLTVQVTAEGCRFRIEGENGMVKVAGKTLFDWSNLKRLDWSTRDRNWSADGGHHNRSVRGKPAEGVLTWSSFTRDGQGRASWLEGEWKRPVTASW